MDRPYPNDTECFVLKKHVQFNELRSRRYINDSEYFSIIREIFENPYIQTMSHYKQHGDTSTLEHSIFVSFLSYKVCKKLRLDHKAAARAGLLHDFYLYDWHMRFKETGERFHGLFHPRIAMNNAIKHFKITKKERNIILRHMFPLTPIPPKSLEGFIVVLVDKYCGLMETFSL